MSTPTLEGKASLLNIVIEQGVTFNPTLTWKDENGDLVDLTGYSASMHIRSEIDSSTTIHEMSDGSGITLGGSAGTIELKISAADTTAFTFDNAVYDLELTDGSGDVTRLVYGGVSLSKEVTR